MGLKYNFLTMADERNGQRVGPSLERTRARPGRPAWWPDSPGHAHLYTRFYHANKNWDNAFLVLANYALMTKAQACLYALKLAKERGYNRLAIQTDSHILVYCLSATYVQIFFYTILQWTIGPSRTLKQ